MRYAVIKILWLMQVINEAETRKTANKWGKYLNELDYKNDNRRDHERKN